MLQDITQVILAHTLDATALRHRAMANNIANVETPGYRRRQVNFESQLRDALDGPMKSEGSAAGFMPSQTRRVWEEQAIENVAADITVDNASPVRENDNNVDIDREMASLAENTIRYEAVLQSLSIKSEMLKNAIHEGRR